MKRMVAFALAACLGTVPTGVSFAELPNPNEGTSLPGSEIRAVILKDFIRFDPQYITHRQRFGDRLDRLAKRLAALQAEGNEMECSNQIYLEAGQSGEARIFLIQDDNLTAEVPLRRSILQSILQSTLRQKYRSTGRHNPQRDGGPEKGLYRLHPIALPSSGQCPRFCPFYHNRNAKNAQSQAKRLSDRILSFPE